MKTIYLASLLCLVILAFFHNPRETTPLCCPSADASQALQSGAEPQSNDSKTSAPQPAASDENQPDGDRKEKTMDTEKTATTPALAASHEEATAWAEKTLGELSLKQKIGQMVCEQMQGDIAPDSPEFQKLVDLVRKSEVGAFVIYGGSPVETARLLNRLQKESKLPLFMTIDFEGGPGQQLKGATEFPANMALAAVGSEQLAYQVGKVGAEEGRACGFHVTYSPVVDVSTRPHYPSSSVRSFGSDVALLGRMAAAYIHGYQDNGMLATAKHFPGAAIATRYQALRLWPTTSRRPRSRPRSFGRSRRRSTRALPT